ncbi:MAG: SUMF1/EgtB/PvdO family nonheme iron enzyme [Solirubrobacterales bacterium]
MITNQTTPRDLLAGQLVVMEETRARTLALVSELSEDALSRVVDPLLSPLLWDMGHIANFEQRWLLGSDDGDLDTIYNPFEQPRAKRGEIPFLHSDECRDYMAQVRDRVTGRFDRLDPYLVELVIQHEQQHNETMLQLLRQLDGYAPPAELSGRYKDPPQSPQHIRLRESAARAYRPASADGSRDWVRFPAGEYQVGAEPRSEHELVYDNEMGAHGVTLDSFEIATHPVTCGEYREWIGEGGYRRRDLWSDAGWDWLEESKASAPLGWVFDGDQFLTSDFGETRPVDDRAPVCHVNWFEAEAYARAHDARLPREFEWEVAASYDPRDGARGERRRHAWGEKPWSPGAANLDQLAFGTLPAGASDHGFGLIDLNGQVWEWTASTFSPYPGFEPFCYREYSAPFFDAGYRVLRGGSWATRARTVNNRFRNWDFPQRRQIFSGFRLARGND